MTQQSDSEACLATSAVETDIAARAEGNPVRRGDWRQARASPEPSSLS
eukprot:CAMPEP_0197885530 /NCGR_PEP_ID=MMETSP1439-20131203/13703_1 /TAXON_ID=66791 /ORGANISM="Gonyaulax spinifera, Strain CCMP409" /LENGTH=47 /DNA_ID= /DNA_START= /DNA_END= /DNA_ORIENTATION=